MHDECMQLWLTILTIIEPAQSHIPVKVIDTPASPPKDLSTRRDYSHSFSESDMSVAKGNGLFSKNLSEDEDDSPEEPGTSVSRTVGGMVWGVASSIFGMIAGSSDHKSLDQIPEGESINSWQPMAPPTDHELKQRGLGFYHPPSPLHRGADGEIIVPQTPRPPDIVAAELDAKVVAYKKGLTPRRDIMVPPNEVILAVDMARAAYIDPAKRPAPLNLQINPAKTLGDAGSISIPFKEQSKHNRSGSVDSTQSSGSNDYAIPIPKRANNGYSMGTSVPEGVRWRYVDVLNTGNIKKKSPSKSPKHRISTVAAINAVKGKGDGGDSQLLFSSGRDISSNRSDGGGFSSSRKASV